MAEFGLLLEERCVATQITAGISVFQALGQRDLIDQ